mmetsp:Transcript_40724/g.75723  ORF Transcript_40724/g.75723 Transcript_40724/m.75723 type:complete len:216 (-) Transcript_40724:653-1300(-)
MRSLIRPRTFTKWSAETRIFTAAEVSAELERRVAADAKKACAFCTAAPAALPSCTALRSCRKDNVFLTGFAATCCKSTSFLLALKFSNAPVLSSSVASFRALSSFARRSERESHCTAFFSHSSLTTPKNVSSAALALSSADFCSLVEDSSSDFAASTASFCVFSLVSKAMAFVRPSTLSSEAFLASNSVSSISLSVLLKVAVILARIDRSSLPWY